jgi:outer membrane lipoprotein SlyB
VLSQAGPGTDVANTAASLGAAAPATTPAPQPSAVKPAPVRSAPPVATRGSTSALGSGTAAAQPLRTRPAAVCERCGTVEGVREVRRQGEAKGIGAVAGGVLGGLLGHQIGKGHGRDAMTVVGAVGGGLAGHEVEKRVRAETVYEVRVRMDDGRLRTLTQKSAPRPGARVTVDGSTLRTVATQDDGGRT